MLREKLAMLDQKKIQHILVMLMDQLGSATAEHEYRLVGTAAVLLHGIDMPAGDVDILLRQRQGIDAFSAGLSPFKCLKPPGLLEEDRQYMAIFAVDGIKVELSTVEWEADTDTIECFGDGPWTHYADLSCGAYRIPTVSLELRLLTEWSRERPERFGPIAAFLCGRDFDVDLVRRGLVGQGMAADLVEARLETLKN
jgi:hypothetical protein